MAALLRDENIEDGFINSMCAAVLVHYYNGENIEAATVVFFRLETDLL